MNKHILSSLSLVFCLAPLIAQQPAATSDWAAKIAPEIRPAFYRGEPADILVLFSEKADLSAAKSIHGKTAKAQFVYGQLVQTASRSQAEAIRILRARKADLNSFFLVNAIAVSHADTGLIRSLAVLPEVTVVASDPDVLFSQPDNRPDGVNSRGMVEWGVEQIHAPSVWAMGYNGQGITVGGADTGYDWMHPALKPHYRGYNNVDGSVDHNYNWHDAIHEISLLAVDSIPGPFNNPCGLDATEPCDDNNHGTHTMGTMTGDDNEGNQIGVAPGAKWIGCRNMERGNGKPSTYIECFQWFLAPTDLNGQNPDVSKAPHVINNSWLCTFGEGCINLDVNELIREAVVNLRASGVVVVASNGNYGAGGCGTTPDPPAYFEESFSVGATDVDDAVTNFSSRGPVFTDNSFRLKPNVVAPGAAVRSCIRNGGYAHFSGTSMAGPHVVGLVALLLSARPDLAGEVDKIEDIIEQTAVHIPVQIDCGNLPGHAYPNNTCGFGRVDALAAVLRAMGAPTLSSGEPAGVLSVSVFPNPVSDMALFQFRQFTGPVEIQLFAADGRTVCRQALIATGDTVQPVPVQHYPAGIYGWQVRTNNQVISGKLVKE